MTVGSLQFADVVIVSVDTRGLGFARLLAEKGWKTVVIELSGSSFNSELEWADRLGPFQSWEPEGSEAIDSAGRPLRTEHAAFWLPSGPVQLGGRRAEAGLKHLRLRYGIESLESPATTLEKGWPNALLRNLASARLRSRESFLRGASEERLPLSEPVKQAVSAEAIARARREAALAAGVRILEAEQITAIRLSDERVDRIEFRMYDNTYLERTRSLVWMLSEEESARKEFVGSGVPLEELFHSGSSEPLMAWWRNRLAVRGLKNSSVRSLTRVPETPPHLIVVGSIERPWTHENIALLDVVEKNPQMRVFDVWTRIPYWARVDHDYRDEQRRLTQTLLADRFVGCDLTWVSPSPLALTSRAVRMAHIVYSDGSISFKAKLENICVAGPETWPGIGLRGIRSMEPSWLQKLENMRIIWDPVARLQASRWDRMKLNLRKWTQSSKETSP